MPTQLKPHRATFLKGTLITGAIAAVLLLIANSAFWVSRTIFDTETFTDIATTSVTSSSSRQAIASEVVNQALSDRPVIREVAGSTAANLVSGLLGTDQFGYILQKAVSQLQIYLTSNQQESIVINLSGVKNILSSLIGLAGESNNQAGVTIGNVPDEIVLLNADNIPSFYRYGVAFLWLGPVVAVFAAALLVYPYVRHRSQYYMIAPVQGALLTAAGLFGLLVGPLFRPPVLANLVSSNARTVVGNLYDAFIASFNSQSLLLVKVGVALAVVPVLAYVGLQLYNRRIANRQQTKNAA